MGSRIQHKPLRGHSNCNAIGTTSLIGKCHAAGLTDPIAYMKSMELQTDFDPTPLRTLSPEAASRPPTTTSQPAGATSLPANPAASQSASQPRTHQPSQQDTKAACSGADLLRINEPNLLITTNLNRFLDAGDAGSPGATWLHVLSCDLVNGFMSGLC